MSLRNFDKNACDVIVQNAFGIVSKNTGLKPTERKMPALEFSKIRSGLSSYFNRRIQNYSDTYLKFAKTQAQQDAISIKVAKYKLLKDLIDLHYLRPGERQALQRSMALALDWTFGATGMAKRTIDQQRKTAISMLDSLGRINIGLAATDLNRTIKTIIPDISTLELKVLTSEVMQVGMLQDMLMDVSDSMGAIALNSQRYTEFRNWALNRYNITDQQLDTIIKAGAGVSDAYDKIRVLLRSMGVNINTERNIGFFHRSFTPLAEKRLQDVLTPDNLFNVSPGADAGINPLSAQGKKFNFYKPTNNQSAALFAEITGLSKGKLYAQPDRTLGFNWLQGRTEDITTAVQVVGGNPLMLTIGAGTDVVTKIAQTIKSNINGTFAQQQGTTVKALRDQVNLAVKTGDHATLSKLLQDTLSSRYDGVIINATKVKPGKHLKGDSWLLNWNMQLDDFMSNTDLVELFDDPYAMLEFIRQRLTRDQVDALVNSGILSQIPMTNMELFGYLNEYFNFGFDDPLQVMYLGIEEASTRYIEQLRTAAKTSSAIQVLTTDDAVTAGWVIRDDDIAYNSKEYQDWVPFGDDFKSNLKTMGLDAETIQSISRMKVHPDIARIYRTYLRIATDPTTQNAVAQALITAANNSTKYGVASGFLGMITRNALEAVTSALAYGTNVFRLKQGQDIIWEVFSTGNINRLDDTKKIFRIGNEDFTLRGAVSLYFKTQADNSAVELPSGLGGQYSGGIGEFLNRVGRAPDNIKQWMMWANADAASSSFTAAELGLMRRLSRNLQAGAMVAGEALDEAWLRVINTSNLIQHGVQLSFFLSQIRPIGFADSVFQTTARALTGELGGYVNSRQELLLRMQDAFIDPMSMGTLAMAGNKGFGMFLQYTIKAPWQFAKAMYRNPVKFYKWGQAQALWRGLTAEQCEANELGFQEFELEGQPHYMGCFTDRDGQKQSVLLFDQNFNSFSKTWTIASGAVDMFMEVAFDDYGNAQSRVNVNASETEGTDRITEIANNLLAYGRPEIQALYGAVTGQDIFGRKITQLETDKRPSFLYWNMPARLRAFVSGMVPVARYLDDLNPGGTFGYAPVMDANGNILYDGQLGAFGNERYPARTVDKLTRYDKDVRLFIWQALKMAGFNVRVTTTANNAVSNARQLDNAISLYEREFQQTVKEIQTERARGIAVPQAEQERRSQAIGSLMTELLWMKNERVRVDLYLQQEGIVPPRVKSAIDNAGLLGYTNIYGLDPLIDQQLDAAAEDVARMLQEYKEYTDGP